MDMEGLTHRDWITLCFRTNSQCLFVPDTRCAPRNGDKLCRKCEERDALLIEKLQFLHGDMPLEGTFH